jgi:hypothetical protein
MRARRQFLWLVGVLLLGFIWYWFRPELLLIDHAVSEKFPDSSGGKMSVLDESRATSASTVLAHGTFRSVAHDTTGEATVYRLDDGQRLLRLTDFATSNGPDVRIVLVAAADAMDSASVKQAATIELGPLKGNRGDQNYLLPAGVDLEQYRAVAIWCHRFSVNFGTAPLKSAS